MACDRLEQDGFNVGAGGGSADFAFTLLFGITAIEALMLTLFYRPVILPFDALLFYVIYVWSRKHPTMSVSMWGVAITGVYVPWVMVSMYVLVGAPVFLALLGIAVGHLFYFLVDVLPDMHDVDLLRTPKFLVNLLGFGSDGPTGHSAQAGMAAPGNVRPPRDIPRAGHSDWGRGQTLGSS